jgi:heme oxygenase
MKGDDGRKQKERINEIKQLAVELHSAVDALALAAVSNKTYRAEFEELARKTKVVLADLEKSLPQ